MRNTLASFCWKIHFIFRKLLPGHKRMGGFPFTKRLSVARLYRICGDHLLSRHCSSLYIIQDLKAS